MSGFNGFHKRYLASPGQFFVLMGRAIATSLKVIGAGRDSRLSQSFAERINLAVSGVNECVYCSHLHTQLALENGISDEEINQLLSGNMDGCPDDEAPVLAYAIHWAESGGKPSSEARSQAIQREGQSKIKRAEAVISMVYMGNMCSNTVEAYRASEMPNGISSTMAFMISWPVAMVVKKMGKFQE